MGIPNDFALRVPTPLSFEPRLIVIRGNSASSKTAAARR